MTCHAPVSSTKPRRIINILMLVLYNVSIMASLRNLPLVAEYGLSAVFYFAIVGLFFLLPCALVAAELATGWPKDGGVYIWVREGLGDRWGFLAIWMQWIHNVAWFPVILSFVATTFAYVAFPELANNKLYILLTILLSFWGMTYLNYKGIRTSSWFSGIGVIAGTIIPGIFIISLGISWVTGGHPIQTELSMRTIIPDLSGLNNIAFLAGLFLAFAGLEVSAGYAAEVKNPQKNFPRAIIMAALITFFLFMLGSLAIAFVIPKSDISLVGGLMEAYQKFLEYYQLTWILPILGILLVIGAIAETNSWIMGPVIGLHATSVHGNLPPFFQKLNRHGMPTNLLLFQAIIVTIVSFVFLLMPTVSGSFWMLSALSAQMYLIMYILMFIAAIRLRYTKPHVPRPYYIPIKHKGIWMVASMGIIASLFAIIIGFIPPSVLKIKNEGFYIFFLLIGLAIMMAIPLGIQANKKESWVTKK